MKWRSSFTVY